MRRSIGDPLTLNPRDSPEDITWSTHELRHNTIILPHNSISIMLKNIQIFLVYFIDLTQNAFLMSYVLALRSGLHVT